jgi:hypothetical protein
MRSTGPPEIKTRTVVFLILFYTLLTNLSDVRNGFIRGWNAISSEKGK